ncbi:MAG TPA: ribosome-associated translation inhibitor RaiA [Burkholderiales bacterium]|nr:ribosome-associated translation inhibitor RaiA [Burkholderiales bacterium]
MNLTVRGHHVAVTPGIRSYIENKFSRIERHFDHVIDVNVILTSDPLAHKAEVTCHVRGKDLFVESDDRDLYAAIDTLVDKLDRQIIKYKDHLHAHPHDALKHRPSSN